eukprot:1194138-Prorocentrum_minimum.AAC.2
MSTKMGVLRLTMLPGRYYTALYYLSASPVRKWAMWWATWKGAVEHLGNYFGQPTIQPSHIVCMFATFPIQRPVSAARNDDLRVSQLNAATSLQLRLFLLKPETGRSGSR